MSTTTRRPQLVDPSSCGDHLVSTVATRSCPSCGQCKRSFDFPKRDVHNGLLLALSKVKLAVWKSMEPRQCADWADTHTKRIRNLCRAVAQGELRSPSAERTRALPWRRRVDHDHDNNIDGSGGVIRIMFRAIITASSLESCGHGAPRQRRLDGRKCRCRLRPHMVEAEWADGHRKAISVLHVGRTQHLQRQQTTSKSPHEPFWQSTMVTTGHKVKAWISRLRLRLSMRVIYFPVGSISCLFGYK